MVLKTALQALNDVVEVMELADLKSNVGLTGSYHVVSRGLSTKEDIVVNSVKSGADQVSETIININIHVPNLKSQSAENPSAIDNTKPNTQRMEEIGKMVMEVFKDYRGYDFFTRLFNSGEVIPNGSGFYYNIVVWYTYLQKDY
ncbi:hypothetical protein ORI89_17415 [Sphingobacterium sp. UT-1RO-CII-1]|uniref:hypothetical protein n=1 Tax=Sphingobacterium sp. UT-1RO-CII-1 TaxID=2995225 RepID=UPI00227AF56D|nr:hypothetical protein [Sphingobacterium sp. UT-1RO-CII-1]MCY4781442.1 hypothetical protein [Sphingobacterium sp. UT-1RO-CII-1]